jgi:small-conductance mechanosensitive channel
VPISFDATQLLIPAVSALLGGGAMKAASVLLTSRAAAKEIRAKTASYEGNAPLETGLIAIKGSEDAVLIMQGVNQRLIDENQRLRADLSARDARITTLEGNLSDVRTQLLTAHELSNQLAAALTTAQASYEQLRIQLAALKQPDPDAA